MPAPASGDSEERSATNLFVCNLPRSVDDQQLCHLFSEYGEVARSMVLRDLHTGESKGAAFVRFMTPDEARRALAATQKKKVLRRKLNVRWAKKKYDEVPVGDACATMRELFTRNVPMDVTEERLREVVGRYGTVEHVKLCEDTCPNPDDQRRIAFISFLEDGAAETALHALHNTCPFRSCRGVPLLCKLKEDYLANPAGRAGTPRAAIPPEGDTGVRWKLVRGGTARCHNPYGFNALVDSSRLLEPFLEA